MEKLNREIKKIVKQIKQNFKPEIFGSAIKKKLIPRDIDLFILKRTKKSYFQRLKELTYSIVIDFFVYTPDELYHQIKLGDKFDCLPISS